MDDGQIVFILFIFLLAVGIAAVGYTFFVVQEKRKDLVLLNSKKIVLIKSLNMQYHFNEIQPKLKLTKQCNSKKEFDRTDLEVFLCECIDEELDYFRTLIKSVQANNELYASYLREYNDIVCSSDADEQDLYAEYEYFEKLERELCENIKLTTTISPILRVKKSYRSPQGRNYYTDYYDFSFSDLISFCEIVEDNKKKNRDYRTTAEYQRRIMTDSLRYDVMKRDGFKCVLCGASQKQDGVRLEVDHIRPVSKGGKTELSNLRTLCERCNRGKRDKYDPYGQN